MFSVDDLQELFKALYVCTSAFACKCNACFNALNISGKYSQGMYNCIDIWCKT